MLEEFCINKGLKWKGEDDMFVFSALETSPFSNLLLMVQHLGRELLSFFFFLTLVTEASWNKKISFQIFFSLCCKFSCFVCLYVL